MTVSDRSRNPQPPDDGRASGPSDNLRRRHLLVGWWSLLAFLTLGLVLDAFHGLKIGWYMDVEHSIRRLMWTLAHTHGTLIGLVNLAFAAVLATLPEWAPERRTLASRCLIAASVLMPGGFLLGGLFIYGGDPGLGAILVPFGGLALIVGVALTVFAVTAHFLPRAGLTEAPDGAASGSALLRWTRTPAGMAISAFAAVALLAGGLSVLRSVGSAPDSPEPADAAVSSGEGESPLDPDDALIAEATAARLANNPLRAIEISREVLGRKPHHYGAKYQLASALELAGRRSEAMVAWRRFLAAADEIEDQEWSRYARERLRTLAQTPPTAADRGRESDPG